MPAISDVPELVRVGVIGDIHCENLVLERVLRYFSSVGVDRVLSVGDVVDGVGDVNLCCSLLVEHRVQAVIGNHDRWILEGSMRELPDATAVSALEGESRSWLEHLPKTRSFQTKTGDLMLCHGFGEDDMAMLRPDDTGYAIESNLALQELIRTKGYRFLVNGHSHMPMVRTVGKLTIVNAGTLDRRHRQVCSVIDFEEGSVQFFDAGGDQIESAERFALA